MSEAGPQGQPDEALVDLLIKQVTEGLTPAEQRSLDALDDARATRLQHELELAAAAISLAGAAPLDTPPAALQALLVQQGQEHFATGDRGVAGNVVDLAAASADTAAARAGDMEVGVAASAEGRTAGVAARVEGRAASADRSGLVEVASSPQAAPRRTSRTALLGWFAAAACLVLALFGWLRAPQEVVAPVADVHLAAPPPMAPATPVPQPPTPAAERERLLAKDRTLKITLGATKDPAGAGVTGDVVWDPETQTGFLHFAGLAPNDPTVRQYQMWIFDGERDARYPIDGGVFDVPAGSDEVVIPIRAVIMVHKPAAFAVTVEKPGGAVVSARDHVVALGKAG